MSTTNPASNPLVHETEIERLRRHLRALSAVNTQLHAQLEGGPRRADGRGDAGGDGSDRRYATLAIRRAGPGTEWIERLHLSGSSKNPVLVRNAKRGNYVIEGALRRQVKAAMLFSALEGLLGTGRVVSAAELDGWSEGPPVEVLEAPSGAAFIVVGGRRLTLRGLPLPHPVTADDMLRFPEGAEIRIGGGSSSAGASKVARVRSVVRRDGLGAGGAKVLSKGLRRLGRMARGTAK